MKCRWMLYVKSTGQWERCELDWHHEGLHRIGPITISTTALRRLRMVRHTRVRKAVTV